MWKHFILLSITISLFSCNPGLPEHQSQSSETTPEALTESTGNLPPKKSVQLYSYTEIDTSGILQFPLALDKNDKSSQSYSKRGDDQGWWNIVFHDSRTGSYHLLTEDKILIRHYGTASGDADAGRLVDTLPYLFYHIVSEDYNRDKLLSEADPQYLFVSDKGGYNLRRVSPRNCSLHSWSFIKGTGKLLITVRKDSDNNREFDEKDELTVLETSLVSGVEATELFPPAFKDKLNALYQKQWKVK